MRLTPTWVAALAGAGLLTAAPSLAQQPRNGAIVGAVSGAGVLAGAVVGAGGALAWGLLSKRGREIDDGTSLRFELKSDRDTR